MSLSPSPTLSEDSPFFTPASAPFTPQQYRSTVMSTGATQRLEVPDLPPTQYYDPGADSNQDYTNHSQHATDIPQYDYNGEPRGNEDYYQNPDPAQYARKPILYHLYHPSTAPSASSVPASGIARTSFFLAPSLHTTLTLKSEAIQATSLSASSSYPTEQVKLPEEVGGYTGLVSLDQDRDKRAIGIGGEMGGEAGWAGYRSRVYKAWKNDGRAYTLRRIEGFRLQHERAMSIVEKWTRISHPGLVSVKEAFTTRAFGDQSIVFVSDFHPTSATLYDVHLSPASSLPPNAWSSSHSSHLNSHQSRAYRPNSRGPAVMNQHHYQNNEDTNAAPGLSEKVLWSYIVQLGSAIKTIHNSGLAVRCLELNRILVTGTNRIRIGGVGVLDVLGWEGNSGGNQAIYQQDDLLSLGKLVVSLTCGSMAAAHNLPKSVDYISRTYSPELKNVILYLLSKPSQRKSIEEALAMMGGKVLEELNLALSAGDSLEGELMKELENGRLVRLLTKFGFINERPEFDHDPRWAETGDRYIIKLFRDFVFHQVDADGRPVTDLSHVLNSLNKLDAGVEEKIMLVSRDEQSCLIVSYREIKNCIESAFTDLTR